MAFDRKKHLKKIQEWIKEQGWKDITDELDEIYLHYKLEEFPYKPHLLIEKDGITFYVNIFLKGGWAYSKKKESKITGFDLYKYRLLSYLQGKTRIQASVIMYNEEEDKFVFKQLDQLKKPMIYFGGFGCRAWHLKPKYNDVVYDNEYSSRQYRCGKCWEKYPHIASQCVKRNYPGGKKIRTKELAMWSISEFGGDITIQPTLI